MRGVVAPFVATVIHIVIARLRSGGKGKEGLWGVVASQASHVERWTAWVPTTRDAGEGGKAGAPPPGGGHGHQRTSCAAARPHAVC